MTQPAFLLALLLIPADLEADEVRARVGQALGRPADPTVVIEATGTVESQGMVLPYRHRLDGGGRFLVEVGGELPRTLGFDGDTVWEVDRNGTARELDLGDREEALGLMWLQSGHWASDRQPFELRVREVTDRRITLDLTLRGGRFAAEVDVDPRTWRPREVRTVDEPIRVGTFRNWAEGAAGHHARTFRWDSEVEISQEYVLAGHQPTDADPERFVPRLELPDDCFFEPTAPELLEAKRIPSGHFLVRAEVDGEDLGWWILDTGAGTMTIDPTVADHLGLERYGKIMLGGVGGYQEGHFRRADVFTLGPMTWEDPTFVEMDCKFLSRAFGRTIAGVIGYAVFSRAIFRFDLSRGRVRMLPPDEELDDDLPWQRLYLYGKHPCAAARFEGGREGVFRLDTGAGSSTLTFHRPAVVELDLLADREVRDTNAGGVGGTVPTKSGRIDYFEIGGHRFEGPEVEFALVAEAAFNDPYTLGNVGGGFLSPFELVLDYGQRRIAFVPQGAPE